MKRQRENGVSEKRTQSKPAPLRPMPPAQSYLNRIESKTNEILDFLRIVEREPIVFDSLYLRDPQLERVRLIYYYRHSEHMNRDNCLLFTINPSQFYSQMAFFVDHPQLFKSVELERLKCFTNNRHKLLTASTSSPNTQSRQRAAGILNSLLPQNHSCEIEAYLDGDGAYGSHFLVDAELGFIQGKTDEDIFAQSQAPSERPYHDSINRAEVVRWLRKRWGGSISHVYLNFQALYHLHAIKISETSRRRFKVEDGVTTEYPEGFCALSASSNKKGECEVRPLPLSIGKIPDQHQKSSAVARGGGVRATSAIRPVSLSLGPRRANTTPTTNLADIVQAIQGHLDNARELLNKLTNQ